MFGRRRMRITRAVGTFELRGGMLFARGECESEGAKNENKNPFHEAAEASDASGRCQ
jgi:hypothetical protein